MILKPKVEIARSEYTTKMLSCDNFHNDPEYIVVPDAECDIPDLPKPVCLKQWDSTKNKFWEDKDWVRVLPITDAARKERDAFFYQTERNMRLEQERVNKIKQHIKALKSAPKPSEGVDMGEQYIGESIDYSKVNMKNVMREVKFTAVSYNHQDFQNGRSSQWCANMSYKQFKERFLDTETTDFPVWIFANPKQYIYGKKKFSKIQGFGAFVVDLDEYKYRGCKVETIDHLVSIFRQHDIPIPWMISQTDSCNFQLLYTGSENELTEDRRMIIHYMIAFANPTLRHAIKYREFNKAFKPLKDAGVDTNYMMQEIDNHKIRVPGFYKQKGPLLEGADPYLVKGWFNENYSVNAICDSADAYELNHTSGYGSRQHNYQPPHEEMLDAEPEVIKHVLKKKYMRFWAGVFRQVLSDKWDKYIPFLAEEFAGNYGFLKFDGKRISNSWGIKVKEWAFSQGVSVKVFYRILASLREYGVISVANEYECKKKVRTYVCGPLVMEKLEEYYRHSAAETNRAEERNRKWKEENRLDAYDSGYDLKYLYESGHTWDHMLKDCRYLINKGLSAEQAADIIEKKMSHSGGNIRCRRDIEHMTRRWRSVVEDRWPEVKNIAVPPQVFDMYLNLDFASI